MKFNTVISTFKNGLMSKRMRYRTDVKETENSAEEITNFLVDQSGTLLKRFGTNIKKIETGLLTSNLKVYSFIFIRVCHHTCGKFDHVVLLFRTIFALSLIR